MPVDVMLVVLLAALLHASWNTMIKAGRDKLLDTILVASGAGMIGGAAAVFLPGTAPACWPYMAASTVIHGVYFALVAAAYRSADMSYAYPLMRGAAPMLVALASATLIGEQLGAPAWAGVALICGGLVGLTFTYRQPGGFAWRSTGFALANAVVIALYTFTDGTGARLSGAPVAYTLWVCFFAALPLLGWVFWSRPTAFIVHLRARWRFAVGGGVFTLGAYSLVLWAMTKAPIAPVAALRETSILFAMALAALVLKERFGLARQAAAATVLAGAIALRLA